MPLQYWPEQDAVGEAGLDQVQGEHAIRAARDHGLTVAYVHPDPAEVEHVSIEAAERIIAGDPEAVLLLEVRDLPTDADAVAAVMGSDNTSWEAPSGHELPEVAELYGAEVEYGMFATDPNPGDAGNGLNGPIYRIPSTQRDPGDPIRYRFPDGSTLIECGDGWTCEDLDPAPWPEAPCAPR